MEVVFDKQNHDEGRLAKTKHLLISETILEAIKDGEKIEQVIKGDSMLPLLKSGDDVTISACPKILTGDLLSYRCEHFNSNILHRYLGKVWTGKTFKLLFIGDNRSNPDALVQGSEIIGRLIAINGERHHPGPATRARCLVLYFYWYGIISINHFKKTIFRQ